MSTYFESKDSSDDDATVDRKEILEADIESIKALNITLKSEGNDFFAKNQYAEAVGKYSEAINNLKRVSLPKDVILLLNRSATYLALKKFVPALNDANQGIKNVF